MAKNKQLTIYQRAAKYFSGGGYDDSSELDNTPTQDPQAQELEALQTQYFRKTGASVLKSRQQRKTYWEYNRYSVYSEIEQMDYDPRIARALDLIAEESTLKNEKGEMFVVTSDNPQIKREIENFIYKRLDIESLAMEWMRDLAKYGEIYFYVVKEAGKGVLGVEPQPGIEMQIDEENHPNDPDRINLVYRQLGDKGAKYMDSEIWHVRLRGDTKYQPYGVSHLDKNRRIWNQLRLAEDAMLVYRATRAPERRIFKVDVGNLDPADVEAYVNAWKNNVRGDYTVDQNTGNVDLRRKFLDVDQDYYIPVRQPNQGSLIETLPGAANLNDIADVEYFMKQLYTGLGIPAPFLDYQEVAGDGKSMAMMDLRFARMISSRFQTSFVSGLVELCEQHLFFKGYNPSDFEGNFKIGMTSPSTQQDLVNLEKFEKQARIYEVLTKKNEFGISPMSSTESKRLAFGMSNDAIMHDLMQQRVENAVSQDNELFKQSIESTGLFDEVDSRMKYQQLTGATQGGGDAMGLGGDMGGGFGGGGGLDLGGGLDMGGGMDMGGGEMDMGGDVAAGGPEIAPESTQRSSDKDVINEAKKKVMDHLKDTSIIDHYELVMRKNWEFEYELKRTLNEQERQENIKRLIKDTEDLVESFDKDDEPDQELNE